MREILFRGKDVDDPSRWVCGFLTVSGDENPVLVIDYQIGSRNLYGQVEIIPDTVGQYTGLQDKNGKRIFEGDILKTHYANAKNSEFVEVVVFRNGRFCAEGNLGGGGRSWALLWDGVPHIPQDKTIYMDGMEIIGNIHDNPELLEGGTDHAE